MYRRTCSYLLASPSFEVEKESQIPVSIISYSTKITSSSNFSPLPNAAHLPIRRSNSQISSKSRFLRLPSPSNARSRTLGTLDEKIKLNRRKNETPEAPAQAICKDWFVDFGPARAEIDGRAPYLASSLWKLFPDVLEGDGIPAGWKISEIGKDKEVCVVGDGKLCAKDLGNCERGNRNRPTPKDLSQPASPFPL